MFGLAPLPVLDDAKCSACNDCIAACPTNCLTADTTGQPWLIRPDDCISCAVCVMLCPDEALSIDPIDASKAAVPAGSTN